MIFASAISATPSLTSHAICFAWTRRIRSARTRGTTTESRSRIEFLTPNGARESIVARAREWALVTASEGQSTTSRGRHRTCTLSCSRGRHVPAGGSFRLPITCSRPTGKRRWSLRAATCSRRCLSLRPAHAFVCLGMAPLRGHAGWLSDDRALKSFSTGERFAARTSQATNASL